MSLSKVQDMGAAVIMARLKPLRLNHVFVSCAKEAMA